MYIYVIYKYVWACTSVYIYVFIYVHNRRGPGTCARWKFSKVRAMPYLPHKLARELTCENFYHFGPVRRCFELYVHICIYIYIYKYVYIHIYTYVYISMCISIHIHMYKYTCIYVYQCHHIYHIQFGPLRESFELLLGHEAFRGERYSHVMRVRTVRVYTYIHIQIYV